MMALQMGMEGDFTNFIHIASICLRFFKNYVAPH